MLPNWNPLAVLVKSVSNGSLGIGNVERSVSYGSVSGIFAEVGGVRGIELNVELSILNVNGSCRVNADHVTCVYLELADVELCVIDSDSYLAVVADKRGSEVVNLYGNARTDGEVAIYVEGSGGSSCNVDSNVVELGASVSEENRCVTCVDSSSAPGGGNYECRFSIALGHEKRIGGNLSVKSIAVKVDDGVLRDSKSLGKSDVSGEDYALAFSDSLNELSLGSNLSVVKNNYGEVREVLGSWYRDSLSRRSINGDGREIFERKWGISPKSTFC